MRARRPAGFNRGAGGVDVLRHARARPQMIGPLISRAMARTEAEVPSLGDGKTGFDDVHAQAGELAGDLQFFASVHRGAGALFAVAKVVSR